MTLDDLIAYYVDNGIPFTTPLTVEDDSYMRLGAMLVQNASYYSDSAYTFADASGNFSTKAEPMVAIYG